MDPGNQHDHCIDTKIYQKLMKIISIYVFRLNYKRHGLFKCKFTHFRVFSKKILNARNCDAEMKDFRFWGFFLEFEFVFFTGPNEGTKIIRKRSLKSEDLHLSIAILCIY